MLGRPMPYILNLRNIEQDDLELAGREALLHAQLFEDPIKTTDGFVLTTRAFDDFITAGNLIEPISESLQKVKPFSKILAKKASEEISNLILNAPIPTILERPLSEAYRSLGDHGNPYIFIQTTNIISQEYLPENIEDLKEINIRGEKELIYKIREQWLSLFTPEAIELRADKNYAGVLSVGVLIKRMTQSEVSGKAYSFSPEDGNKHLLEVHALYGFDDPKDQLDNEADIYRVDKQTLKIVEKNIFQQNKMIVRKGNYSPGENPNIKIEISEQWKKTQKLTDKQIETLASTIQELEKIYSEPIEILWGLEFGDFTILNVEKFTIKSNHKKANARTETIEKIFRNHEVQSSDAGTIFLPNLESYVAKNEIVPAKNYEEPKATDPQNFTELVAEVQNIANNQPLTPIEQMKDQAEILDRIDQRQDEIAAVIPEQKQEEYKSLTPVFLEVSKMNTEVLTKVTNFNGGFLDGTEIILNNNAFPEEMVQSEQKLNQAINIFTMDISTSAKLLDKESLIYQFSNITEETLKLLGLDETKYKYLRDDRFIETPESLTVEILALKKSRNQMNYKNINLAIPAVKSYENLIKIKKLIATQGLRRSSSLKMYAEVSLPSFIFEIKLLEEGDIDGIIIDYEKLFTNSTGKHMLQENDHKVILNQIEVIKDIIGHKKLEFWVKIRNTEYRKDVIEKILSLGVSGIILRDIPDNNLGTMFKEAEKSNVLKLKPLKRGRGRSIKDLL